MYWWHKSAQILSSGKSLRFGLITTNTIRQAWQRVVIDKHLNSKDSPVQIIFAIPDHPWSDNGADVRISMTSAESSNSRNLGQLATLGIVISEDESTSTPEEYSDKIQLEWKNTGKIFSDLRSGADVGFSVSLQSNSELASTGIQFLGSGFILSREEAIKMGFGQISGTLAKNNDVIKKYRNGKDLMGKLRDYFVIDFDDFSQEKASLYLEPFQRVLETVKPEREVHRDKQRREKWWRFGRANTKMRTSLLNLSRYIATTQTSKHRVFQFLSADIIPDQKIVAIATDDAYHLAVLSSHIHVKWSIEAGGWLGVGNDSVYNHSRCFDPFPLPSPTDSQKQKIRELGDRLDSHRKQVQNTHSDITITGMYNLLEKLRAGTPFTDSDRDYNNRALVSTLKQIHDELDAAVFEAYGWSPTLTDEAILEHLVALNADRAAEERNGHIRWLRPEYQAPEQTGVQQAIEGVGEVVEEARSSRYPQGVVILPTEQQPFPKNLKDQLAAIRDLLRTQGGEWTAAQVTAHFKGANRKAQTIRDCLESLEDLGILLSHTENSVKCWYLVELQKVS
jgi:hypothetical protein